MAETYRPDLARDAAFELIDARWFGDRQAFAFYQLPAEYLEVGDDEASVALYTTGGNEGDYDRTDRLTDEVHAPGTEPVRIAEDIKTRVGNDGNPHELEARSVAG